MEKLMPTPLTKEQIENIKSERLKKNSLFFKKIKILGCFISLLGFSSYFLIPSPYNTLTSGPLYAFGFSLMFLPILLSYVTDYEKLITVEYTEAPHNVIKQCEVYIDTPNMEPWKDYVNEVNKQGRILVNFECNALIGYWNQLNS